jgi:glycerol-3-phosphate dehydrogenase (NAD(P)+)
VSDKSAILGAGSWGTALAVHLSRARGEVHLWGRDGHLLSELQRMRSNLQYLPAVRLDDSIRITDALAEAVSGASYVVLAVPSHGLRAVARRVAPLLARDAVLVSAAKGLEEGSLARMSEAIAAETSGSYPVVVLSGPSFAEEVARGLPTAVLAASADQNAVSRVQEHFRGPAFRVYASDDVTGVEIGGALKNVIAIAAGVVQGIGLGQNSMAALITRGLAEISRLASAEGGRRETLAGLAGLGDLVLTCTGDLSRNRRVGIELGRGRTLDDILSHMHMVAEGVRTTGVALALAARHGIELPIACQMKRVLDGESSPRAAVEALMLRKQKTED